MIGLPDWLLEGGNNLRQPHAVGPQGDGRGVGRGTGGLALELLADAAEPLADLGRRAVASRRQQVQNGRPATQQFVLRRLALGQLG